MRSCWSLVLAVSVAPLPADAEPELAVLGKGGLCAATFNRDNRFHRYRATGGLGGYLEYSLSRVFSLGSEVSLLYTPRGARIEFDGESLGESRLGYVDLLFAARPTVRLGRGSAYLLLGGALSLLVNAQDEDQTGMSRDVADELHRVDVALLVGAGATLHLRPRAMGPLSLGSVFVEARHDHGLRDVDKLDLGFRNRTTSLMLGVGFVLASRSGARSASPLPQDEPPPLATAAALTR